jgi:hypothetical protein
LNHALEVVELFFTCSGLRANFDKAQAVWIGARQGCGENFKQINPSSGIIPVHLSIKNSESSIFIPFILG